MLTITQLSKQYGFSRQAIVLKIREGAIPAKMKFGRYYVHEKDYLQFLKNRYVRYKKHLEDFRREDGFMSPRQACEVLKVNMNKLYYDLVHKKLPSKKIESAWIIHISDLMEYKEKFLSNYKFKGRNNGMRISGYNKRRRKNVEEEISCVRECAG